MLTEFAAGCRCAAVGAEFGAGCFLNGGCLRCCRCILTGKLVQVKAGSDVFPMCVERVDGQVITFRWMPEEASNWTSSTSLTIIPEGAPSGVNVFGTLVYGENAFGDVALGGDGGNVKIIINPPGSSGAADPLEQRGTIAWKVRGYTAAILQDSFMVRIEHGATA